MESEDPEQLAATIVSLVKSRLPQAYHVASTSIQVLTPVQRSVIGASNLNISIQQAVNPVGEGLQRGGYTFRKNDRVMQLKNDYQKEVFNGDMGIVTLVNMEDRTLTVDFDGKSVEYESSELDELSLSYATTIHKGQGSEYPIVIIPVHFTRAKKICILIGTRKALWYAVNHNTVTQRNTLLKERLQGKIVAVYQRKDDEDELELAAEEKF